MKMILTLAALTAATSSFAQEVPAQREWSYTLSSSVVSKYVGGTGGALFTDKPAWQTGILASHKSGGYVLLWQSLPLDRKYWDTFDRETDVIVGLNRNVTPWLNVDASVGVYLLVPTTNLYPINLTLTGVGNKVTPYLTVEYDVAGSKELMPGTIVKLGARSQFDHSTLCWDASFLGNSDPYGGKTDNLSGARLQLSNPFKVGSHDQTLTPFVILQHTLGHSPAHGGIVGNHTIFGLTWRMSL